MMESNESQPFGHTLDRALDRALAQSLDLSLRSTTSEREFPDWAHDRPLALSNNPLAKILDRRLQPYI